MFDWLAGVTFRFVVFIVALFVALMQLGCGQDGQRKITQEQQILTTVVEKVIVPLAQSGMKDGLGSFATQGGVHGIEPGYQVDGEYLWVTGIKHRTALRLVGIGGQLQTTGISEGKGNTLDADTLVKLKAILSDEATTKAPGAEITPNAQGAGGTTSTPPLVVVAEADVSGLPPETVARIKAIMADTRLSNANKSDEIFDLLAAHIRPVAPEVAASQPSE